MHKLVISLAATAGLVLASSMWVVHATPLTVGIPSQGFLACSACILLRRTCRQIG